MFEFENSDLRDAYDLKFLLVGANCPHCKKELPKSWEALRKHWQVAKDQMLIEIMDVSTKAKRDATVVKAAMMKGFVELCAVPERLVKFADEETKRQEEEEAQHVQQ